MLNRQKILHIVQQLDFPREHVWLLTGAALVVYGIKDHTRDIDIGCTHEFFETHCLTYPGQKTWADGMRSCEILPYVEMFEACAVQRVVLTHGIPLASLEDIIRHKRQLGRPKDIRDIALIKAHCSIEQSTQC